MLKSEKYIELIKTTFGNIAAIQKTPYTETETTNNIVAELAKVLGKNYNSGMVSVNVGTTTLKHDLGYEPNITLMLVNCSAFISAIDETNVSITITIADTTSKIKIIAS